MRAVRIAERMLFGAGLALVSLCAVAYCAGLLLSRVALSDFKAEAKSAEVVTQNTISPVDVTLWSDRRVRDYRASVTRPFGPPLAVLRIARIRLEVPVFDGTDDMSLIRGVGRITGTARLGERGNIGIAGHRDGFFRGLKDISPADTVELVTRSHTATYIVDSVRIVSPEEVGVLASGEVPALTLVTCYPFYFIGSAPKRFIVHASRAGWTRESRGYR